MPPTPNHTYIALDLETTGLSASSDRIVEVGAVRFDGQGVELGRFERLVNPGRPMPAAARAVNGISDAELVNAPPASVVLPAFRAFLGPPEHTTLLAHNAAFDTGFLTHEFLRLGLTPPAHRVIDTLPLARARLPHLRNHRLDSLVIALKLDPSCPHRALADSLRVKQLWLALGGDDPDARPMIAYRMANRGGAERVPVGWEVVAANIGRGRKIRLVYEGGSRGECPRDVTPRGFAHRGGVAYLVALCHLDAVEKQFRIDRVRSFEVLP